MSALRSEIARTEHLAIDSPFWGHATPAQRFMETIVAEAHNVAISVAVVTTAVNALDDWHTQIDPKAIADFRPQMSALMSLLIGLDGGEFEAHFSAPLAAEALELIASADANLNAYFDDCATLNPSRAATLHSRVLQIAWRPAAKRVAQMVVAWNGETRDSIPDLYEKNAQVLNSLLCGASSGLRPCLNATGQLYVPELPQRRRHARRAMLECCTVFSNGVERDAYLRDVSAGGLGLDQVQGLKRGDVISVSLNTGRHLTGRVTWSTANGAGVILHQPLPANDPLIVS